MALSAAVSLRIRSFETDDENPPRGLPLKSLLEMYCRGRPAIGAGAIAQYRNAVNLARRWLLLSCQPRKRTDCDELFALGPFCDFARWLSAPSNGKTREAATINGRVDVLWMLWSFASDEGLCSYALPPPRKKPRWKEPKRDPVAFTLDEIERLIAACVLAPAMRKCLWWSADHWVALVCTYLAASERFEALLLCPRRALQGNVLTVPAELTKDAKENPVVLQDAIAERLRRLPIIEGKGIDDSPLFFPYPFNLNTLRSRFDQDILARAQLPRTRYHKFHCLRRSSITQIFIMQGLEKARQSARHFSQGLTLGKYISQSVVRQQTGTPNFDVPCPKRIDRQKKLFPTD
jgi:integrase